MSTSVQATARGRKRENVARKRWIFRISLVLAVLPAFYLPGYFDRLELFRGAQGLGARDLGELAVGPWTLRLAEWDEHAPESEGLAGHFKAMTMACAGCSEGVKAVYARVGEPRTLRAPGAIFFGPEQRQFAELHIPSNAVPESQVWITLVGWDDQIHQRTIPLSEVSPSTVAWLQRRKP